MCSNYPPVTADDDYVCKENVQKYLRVSKDQIDTKDIQDILEHLRHGTSAQFVRDIHNVSSNPSIRYRVHRNENLVGIIPV